MTPAMKATFLEYHESRKKQLKVDAANMLKMRPSKTREEDARQRRGSAPGFYPLESLAPCHHGQKEWSQPAGRFGYHLLTFSESLAWISKRSVNCQSGRSSTARRR